MFRETKFEFKNRVGLDDEAYKLLRIAKPILKKSMSRIVSDLVIEKFGKGEIGKYAKDYVEEIEEEEKEAEEEKEEYYDEDDD